MIERSGYGPELDDSDPGILSALPRILWERRWLVIIPTVVIAVAALAAAYLLPPTYRSSAVLLVESQELPMGSNSAPLDDAIDRRMAKIRQQILSRPDLVELIQTNNLYDVSQRKEPLSLLVDRMRSATQISTVDADISRGPSGRAGQGSIAFSLAFEYPRPLQSQLIAQTFVDRLLKLDASASQAEAATSVQFLEDQEQTLNAQQAAILGQIDRITGTNGASLAAASGAAMMAAGATPVGQIENQIAALRRENTQLQSQSGNNAVQRDPGVVAAEATLAAVRAQYADTHPDVKLAETRLAAAKANASSFQNKTASVLVQQQIALNNGTIADLQRAQAASQSRAAAMAAAQARGPQVAQQVAQLQARADSIRGELTKVSSNLRNARSISKLAEQQRGERLTLIDPPVVPDTPVSPNRLMIILGGIAAGLGTGLVLALGMELIRRPIRSVATLTKIVGAPPLAVVPVLSRKRARRRRSRSTAAAAAE